MRINSKHYLMLFLGLCSVIATGLGYFYVYDSVIVNSQKKAALIREIEIDFDNKKNEQFLSDVNKATEQDRTKLANYFISEDRVLDFITSIENLEKISSTTVVLSSLSNDNTSSRIRVSIDIKGGWSNVKSALALIENLPYSINIDNINLSSDSTGKWNMVLSVRALSISTKK